MMIMAQHPTQQKTQGASLTGNNNNNGAAAAATKTDSVARQHHKHLREKPNNIEQISTNVQHNRESSSPATATRELQDGKRTLIKNQLYLIEQLQLENANLRNERDQLQLENEELKFQLQMISSSNILGQSSGSAFDDRQLDKLVGTNGDIVETTACNDIRTVTTDEQTASLLQTSNPRTTQSVVAFNMGHLIPTTNTCDNHSAFATNSSSLSKINATPVRQPMRLINCNDLNETDKQSSSRALNRGRILSTSNHDLRTPLIQRHTDGDITKTVAAKSVTSTPILNKKLLITNSIPISAFNVKSSLLPSSLMQKSRGDLKLVNLDENDEQMRFRHAEQIYGDNERVHAAAIIIQRAFREYRICKRFRMITEQLRHTCQSSIVTMYDSKKSSDDSDSDQRSNSRQSSRSTSDKNSSADSVPYASGATRAATCESLSQAANYLAASAATGARKQENGFAKSASCQHVASFAAGVTSNLSKNTMPTNGPIDSERSRAQMKSDSVIAAAINFQQLESIRKRQYRVGLNIFNKSPEKGISFLIAHSFIDCSPPYIKTSTSYYLSNQLHFIDKQRLTAQQQSINHSKTAEATTNPPTLAGVTLSKAELKQSCRLCQEEENLKRNVAHFLLHRKGLAKEKIGEYLGNLQSEFIQDILVYYLQELDFNGLQIDVALRKFSSTLRMPGEAQKIERFVDRFACRYVECQQPQPTQTSHDYMSSTHDIAHLASDDRTKLYNGNDHTGHNVILDKNNLTMLSKDEIFILTFAIVMLNTDLHSPSLKSITRMSAHQFINNLRGVFKSQTINESDLLGIYERVKANQITTSPDHVTHVLKVQQGLTTNNFQKKEIPNLCVPHRRLVCFCRLFEVYDVTKKERLGQHQREIFLFNDVLLVTKLARRARANAPQQYTYRQSIPLQGLYVQLSQSAHYSFGIKLCRRSNNETLIMFNARNELDQGRFVDDLNESIAEMDEMEHIKVHNIVESIHLKQLDRFKRHAMMHESEGNDETGKTISKTDEKVIIMEDNEGEMDNTSGSNYSSFNSNSAAGSLMALCTKPARMRCTVTMAAPAPMVVEPLDK